MILQCLSSIHSYSIHWNINEFTSNKSETRDNFIFIIFLKQGGKRKLTIQNRQKMEYKIFKRKTFSRSCFEINYIRLRKKAFLPLFKVLGGRQKYYPKHRIFFSFDLSLSPLLAPKIDSTIHLSTTEQMEE